MSRQSWLTFLVKNDSNYLDVKLWVFKKDDNKDFRLVQNLTMEEAGCNQVMRLRNQLVIATENLGRGKLLSSADTNNVQTHKLPTPTGPQDC